MNPLRAILPEPTNAEKIATVKKAWDEKFGEHSGNRTKDQWVALISQYGVENVCKMEKLTIKQLRKKIRHA